MALNVDHLLRTADTSEQALLAIQAHDKRDDVRTIAPKIQAVFDAAA